MSSRYLILALSLPLLAACSEPHQDLQSWMDREAGKMVGDLEPMPAVKEYIPAAYVSSNGPDPFSVEIVRPSGRNAPDIDRVKEPLELVPLDGIRYAGMMRKKGVTVGLVTAEGKMVSVRKGNYMGLNNGIITDINEDGIQLKELVESEEGDWVEKTVTLQLTAQQE